MAAGNGERHFVKFANLLVRDDGRIFITPEYEYCYERKYNKQGVCDGYAYVTLWGTRKMAVHKILGKTIYKNPHPEIFDRLDHINRDRFDFRLSNLRWTNAHLNAINRENVFNTKFDYDVRMWYSTIWIRGEERLVGFFTTFREAHRANMEYRRQVYNELENFYLSNV